MEASEAALDLAFVVDRAISIIDNIDSTLSARRPPGLKAPQGTKCSYAWPPSRFSPLDIAIIAETATRKALYGVNNNHPLNEKDAPLYPNDQDQPLVARKFLCWLSLVETKPLSKTSLFLAPVAFLAHQEREDWYRITGHKSRFYATVSEFIDYARAEFEKVGANSKHHVMGLLTPWFFEKNEIVADAEKRGRAIPISWERGCFRAGMMLRINKIREPNADPSYQVVLFKPSSPIYAGAVDQRPGRREKQDEWIDKLWQELHAGFAPQERWIGGAIHIHLYPVSRNVPPDSVEVTCELIEATMRDGSTFPTTSAEFLRRGYTRMGQYQERKPGH
ncbi:uncharacterized protein GGS22DRAFT_150992 [Annulohypoxylon maeteangense]|uniref:uncharacterized protein n=1 Tax=Annulohypoxylon maeteangense TaxID=1927788 RepID=UPI0020083E2D|nr:uncharacterized protein GGS22DRAFT_150992 [Annulohypoxylon maeteangense]KAI0890473.1 hypothetical protein GGS22DRAFT_150992 [Annulohypoxylon maeteangense]